MLQCRGMVPRTTVATAARCNKDGARGIDALSRQSDHDNAQEQSYSVVKETFEGFVYLVHGGFLQFYEWVDVGVTSLYLTSSRLLRLPLLAKQWHEKQCRAR